MRHIESNIQKAFVTWFRLQFPEYALNLTSVPNGGARRRKEAAIMKAEGVTAGAADILLLVPRGGYGVLGIEFKTLEKSSRQSQAQKRWQEAFEKVGNKYAIARTFDEAVEVVRNYLQV
jgi:hypothetical protein